MNIERFQTELQKNDIHLTQKQLDQFETYWKMLVKWNEKINLTAITEREEVYLKHFYDSLTGAFYFPFVQKENDPAPTLCDVGAGAGFPSIPIKIAFPHLQVTIVDSLKKRITFLEELAKELQLENVHFYHDRAETFGQNPLHREKYDIVTARAVARLSVLSELCLPLVKKNGYFIAFKGSSGKEELVEAQKALSILGAHTENVHHFHLPIEDSERTLLIFKKDKQTPKKYPRKPGVPSKNPL